MSDGALLVTGADGYVGRRVVRHYLEGSDRPLTLWVRSGSRDEFERKRADLLPVLTRGSRGAAGRITWACGDLRDADPFASVGAESVTDIVHSAAVTRFTVDADTARTVNTEGTRKLLRFAAGCPTLRSVAVLSTVYASGLRPGSQPEAMCGDEAGFANHYEHSKWRAEQHALCGQGRDLPVRVLRLATVIADDEAGSVGQYNAVHNTLKLFFYGLLSLLPGVPETPLYFITGDFAARSVAAVLDDDDARGIYHVAPARSEAITLGHLVELAFEQFNRSEAFSRKRILPPLYTDRESFELLVAGLSSLGGTAVNQALASVAPFARQLFVDKDVSTSRLRAVLGDEPGLPDMEAVIARTCAHLVSTRWGRDRAA